LIAARSLSFRKNSETNVAIAGSSFRLPSAERRSSFSVIVAHYDEILLEEMKKENREKVKKKESEYEIK
jgi:hypothetical protein